MRLQQQASMLLNTSVWRTAVQGIDTQVQHAATLVDSSSALTRPHCTAMFLRNRTYCRAGWLMRRSRMMRLSRNTTAA
jgi:hypothetical protein